MHNLQLKSLLQPFQKATYDFDIDQLRALNEQLFADNLVVNFCHPFETRYGYDSLLLILEDLQVAIPDLERRETIVIEGYDDKDLYWVGCCGYYTGAMRKPWLDIPATGLQVHMRFHEFFRFENNKVVEVQALWDIPELMMQARVWPMVPSLGCEWHVPGPSSQDGVHNHNFDEQLSKQSLNLVTDMLNGLMKYATEGVEGMGLDNYWHPKSSWYGPSGIGTGRGIQGFRDVHQKAFLAGMPNRNGDPTNGHLFAENSYVGFTGWPGMHMTISDDGWLGIPPGDKPITMRSLDFWRNENGMLRENWVLIDLLHVYHQLGVDVLARMRDITRNQYR